MQKLIAMLFICTGLFATPVLAGSGHDHGNGHGHSHGTANVNMVANKASKKVKQLAKEGKIDASWSGVKPSSAGQKTFANQPEWVITFKNDKVSDKSKQTLYLYYSLNGHYIAANYTGQ